MKKKTSIFLVIVFLLAVSLTSCDTNNKSKNDIANEIISQPEENKSNEADERISSNPENKEIEESTVSTPAIADDSFSNDSHDVPSEVDSQPGDAIDIYDDSTPFSEIKSDIYYNDNLIITCDECISLYTSAMQGFEDCLNYENKYPDMVNSLDDIVVILSNCFSDGLSKKLALDFFTNDDGKIVPDIIRFYGGGGVGGGHIVSVGAISDSVIVLEEVRYYRDDIWNEDFSVCVNKVVGYASEELLLVKEADKWVFVSLGVPSGLSCSYYRDDTKYNDIELKEWKLSWIE